LPSIAKLTQPSAAGILPRERLLCQIDQKRSYPVIWITGPAGSGKTTLVSSYLAARNLSCLWYQVDEGDGDIASFFYYLGLAAGKAFPRKKQALPKLTPEYLNDIAIFTRRYFERLYGRFFPRRSLLTKEGAVVVFDNYQEAPESSPFHETIRQGLSQIPEGVNAILISRSDPPGIFARMRANGLMGIIGWEDLRFTLDESMRMIRHRGHTRISAEAHRQLHERTDGWAAGLVLLTEGTRAGGAEAFSPGTHIPEEVFDYFAGEILKETDRQTQIFLLKTAYFSRMTSQMAEALTGHPQSKRILAELNRKNYFTERHGYQPPFYQYHPLFRDFLKAQSKESFPSQELSRIEHRAATILAAEGQVEDAVKLLVKAEKWSDLVPLVLEQAPALVSQGRSQTLETWLGNLPGPLVDKNPWLLYWLGVCRLLFAPAESRPIFLKAFNLFRAGNEATGVFLALSGLFDSTTYGTSDFKAYDQWIDLLKQTRKEYKTFPSEEIEARLTASVTFSIIARRPAQPEFESWIERALYLVNRSSDLSVKTRTLQSLASHYIFEGNLSKAALIIDSFHEITRSPDISPQLLILLKMLESIYYWMSGLFEECRKAAIRGLDIAASTGVHLWDAFLLGHAAAGALSKGDTAEARVFLKKISPTLQWIPTWGREYYHVLAGWAYFLEGDFPNALSHAESSVAFSAEAGMVLTEAFDHLGKTFVLVESMRGKEARDQIKLVRKKARSLNLPLVEFTSLLIQARLAFNEGRESSGLETLKKAMILGSEQGYINTFFWHAPIMADLCRKALDAEIEVEYVRTLIRKRSLYPDPPPYASEQWPWPLKIFTLGRFELVKDGDPLEFDVKAPRKMLSLLKVLVASGRKGLSEEQLTDAIWPEAEGDLAHQAFATILHRLRQLLGNKKVIRLRKGHLSFDDRYCWTDAHAFEYLIEKAEDQEDMPLLHKAVRLYGGPFLGDDDSEPWAISYRERLRSKFLRAIGKLGGFHERKEEHEKAVELYQIGLEVDGLSEEFYRRLMLCYLASGRKAEALAVYTRCRETLIKILGIEPSPQTQNIYEALKKNN